MNKQQFEFLMRSVDDDLLEEAQHPLRRRSWLWAAGSMAACLAVLVSAGLLLARPDDGPAQIANPMREATRTEVEQLGYVIPLPEDAQDVSYFLIDNSDQDETPMAEADFQRGGTAYSFRALKTAQAEDISGIYADWTQSLDWTVGSLEMQLRQAENETTAWVGWYDAGTGVQWCLSGEKDALSLLHTAQSIVETLGYDMAVAPPEAVDVTYNAFELDGLTVGETVFSLDGVTYSYRTAATGVVEEEFADISGLEGPYQHQAEDEILWCQARLSYNDGGAGKIIWFDVAPGLLYSLSMDQGASEEALLAMADRLFTPAQGEVG